jgi:dTDP-4-amino-4,6-dideoxygalactose transaminase
MMEMQAALLSSKLRRYQRDQVEFKQRNGAILAQGLREIGGLEPLRQDERITQRGYYLFVARYDSEQFGGLHRDRFAEALRAEGVPCGNYGIPLYKQPAFKREKLAALLPESSKPWPDYESMNLPAAERFCAEEQILFPHQILLADSTELEIVLDAVAKIKDNVGELLTAQ